MTPSLIIPPAMLSCEMGRAEGETGAKIFPIGSTIDSPLNNRLLARGLEKDVADSAALAATETFCDGNETAGGRLGSGGGGRATAAPSMMP